VDVSEPHAVDQVPHRTAGDQGQRDTEEDRAFGQAAPVREDEQQDHAAEDGQDDGLRGSPPPESTPKAIPTFRPWTRLARPGMISWVS